MEQAGSVIHSTFAIDVMKSGGYEGARNECKKSEIQRRIEEVVHFTDKFTYRSYIPPVFTSGCRTRHSATCGSGASILYRLVR
jgi:hypothetical protein